MLGDGAAKMVHEYSPEETDIQIKRAHVAFLVDMVKHAVEHIHSLEVSNPDLPTATASPDCGDIPDDEDDIVPFNPDDTPEHIDDGYDGEVEAAEKRVWSASA